MIQPTTITTVPFASLFRSPLNMRQGAYNPGSIETLSALIEAEGLINPLSVVAELDDAGKPTGRHGVIAGGRRLASISRLVDKAAEGWNSAKGIEVKVYDQESARSVSLSENSGREDMHPIDECVAFNELLAENKHSIEAIAARYGVKPLYVRQRVKLANVAPEFITMCRNDELELDELEALALTDDHEEQRRVVAALGPHRLEAYYIRSALTKDEVAATDKKAKFVGLKAYEKAGGQVRRDMFDESHTTLQDSGLLQRLVIEKLQKAADKELHDGANWVEIEADGCDIYSHYPAVRQITVETPESKAKLAALKSERTALYRERDRDATTEERIEEIDERLEAIDADVSEIEEACEQDDPNQLEAAGTVVTIGYQGKLEIHRNRLRAADMRRIEAGRGRGGQSEDGGAPASADHSDSLIRRLTAHRTAALQVELSNRPDVALVALTASMLASKFRVSEWMADDEREKLALTGAGVAVTLQGPALQRHISNLDDVTAVQAFGTKRDHVEALLRAEVKNGDVFGWLIDKPQVVVMELMAFCAASAMDTVELGASSKRAAGAAVAEVVGLDMRRWWKPTAADYFKAVAKPVTLRAIAEITGKQDDGSLEALKKGDLAKHAEGVMEAAGWTWLPAPIRN